ncbi:MAG: hypothetical protein JNK82_35775, partial [Myxococcaceae bacterium]|nr:hypothetical protein [Myxococcaceae bacterium]
MASFKDQLLKAGLVSAGDARRAELDAEREKADAARRRVDAAQEASAARHVATARRQALAVPITLAQVRELFAPHRSHFAELERAAPVDGALDPEVFTLPSAQLVDGDLTLDELTLESEGSNLFVRGSLRVERVLQQQFRAGGLVVFGALSARHVVTTGAMLCLGDLHVSGTLFGNSTNYATDVLGAVDVGTLVSSREHLFSFWGQPRTIHRAYETRGSSATFERYGGISPGALRPSVTDLDDEGLVLSALREHD